MIPKLTGDGSFSLEVVGESNYTQNFEAVFGKRSDAGVDELVEATLICEPTNPYDPNAVRVEIGGLTVGYVGRHPAPAVKSIITRNGGDRVVVDAEVRGGWDRGDGDVGTFGVRLDIVLSGAPVQQPSATPAPRKRPGCLMWAGGAIALLLLCSAIGVIGSWLPQRYPSAPVEATRTPSPTWTPTTVAAPAVEQAAPASPWAAIVAAYVGPDGNPADAELRQSFTAIMESANEIVMGTGYTADDIARAQAIFDAAAGAHDALVTGDGAALALRWKSLDTFVALLRNAGE